MTTRKELVTISCVTDHDTGMYHMGEIDGIFQRDELEDYIRNYGATELIEHLAYLVHQVVELRNKINGEEAQQGCQAGN